ncbi:hypothetical protein BN2476_840027 [Paraburkholderia piptadeniae]|uniref:Uncharacterized protein n=1 Tax=Paraburkholderia piptadeniae TaxID=1701573 RepID=A0A1N7ST90_9BURK|nr:hypothetical protein BN2476_840027 [Paraburkholderia piptadeniae]
MPAFVGTLNDVQIANVLTYLRSAWGNNARPITANGFCALREIPHN